MDIEEIMKMPVGDAVAALMVKTIQVPSWSKLVKEYDTSYHPVMDRGIYPDVVDKKGHIDYVTYKAELDSLHSIQAILEDNHAGTEQIYRYLSDHGVKMQFHSFEEFDQKMQDDNFILEI